MINDFVSSSKNFGAKRKNSVSRTFCDNFSIPPEEIGTTRSDEMLYCFTIFWLIDLPVLVVAVKM